MSYSADLDVRVTDSSLRDGSHAIRHQFTVENVRTIVAALDEAGVPVIEVTHGDGLGGSSFNYGFSAVPDQDLISTAVATAKQAKIAFLMLPGLGTTDDIRQAADNGASVCRIATHCTEADISIQHFKVARSIGLETVGFLMMAHSQPPEVLAKQARIMADAGAQCVYVVDSAGSLIMDGVSDRIAALVAELGDDAQVGFHGHENLGLGVANSVLAARAGRQADRRLHPPVRGRGGQHPGRGVRRRHRAARDQDRHRHPQDHRRRRGDRRTGTELATRPRSTGSRSPWATRASTPASSARGDPGEQVRRVRRRDPHRGRPPQARRRAGRPAHRDRGGPRQPQVTAHTSARTVAG